MSILGEGMRERFGNTLNARGQTIVKQF